MPLGAPSAPARFDVVVPTAGRASLGPLLERVVPAGAERVIVVDDRHDGAPLRVPDGVTLLRSGGRGPAAARNAGWRAARRPGSRSSTTTWCPRRVGDGPGADLAAAAADVPASRGACRAAARRPAPDRLGAQRRGSGARGGQRPTWRTAAARCARRRLRRALPARLPRGRRPRAAGARRGLGDRARPRTVVHPVGAGGRGSACPSRPATPTTR